MKRFIYCLLIYLLVIFILSSCFINYVVIGQGSFGTVEKGLWNNLPIVLKKLNETYSEEMRNVFSKEAKLLNDARHENIIELLAVCDNPATIMLELCELSMNPFQGDQSFHSLDKFLKYLAKNELLDFFPGICDKITNDILQSIFYIHSKNIVHRDIKPANILVNNLHYCNASQEDAIDVLRKNPLTCKLADLGEARPKIIQVRVLTENTRTVSLCRGCVAYMAPETSIDKVMKSASIEQLKAVDIWAFALATLMIINPDQDYPYQMNIELLKKESDETDLLALRNKCLTNNTYPIFSIKYEAIQATRRPHIRQMVLNSMKFDWQHRPTINDIFQKI